MPYTPPAGNAVNFTWQGATGYTAPAGNAVDLSFQQGVTGEFAGSVAVAGEFAGTITVNQISGEFVGNVGVFGELLGGHGVAASAVGQVDVAGAFAGDVGAAGAFTGSVPLSGAFVGVHPRYEVAGEVRDGGILVNRRVRVYNRATGALIAEADTVGGQFAIHAGWSAVETYVLPIHLDSGAVDFAPPCANRVTSVLASS